MTKKSYIDVRHAFFVWISEAGIELFKKRFKVIEQRWLMLQQWCDQTRAMLDNKMPMNLIWVGPIGYQWWWRVKDQGMTKHTWLTKPRNFERVPSNLLGRLIHGSCGWGYLVDTHPKEVEARLVCKWTTNSQSVWFSCSRFLRTTRNFSMPIDMIMNIVKYDINKRWVIHNLCQQKMGNLWFFEKKNF